MLLSCILVDVGPIKMVLVTSITTMKDPEVSVFYELIKLSKKLQRSQKET